MSLRPPARTRSKISLVFAKIRLAKFLRSCFGMVQRSTQTTSPGTTALNPHPIMKTSAASATPAISTSHVNFPPPRVS